MTSRKAGSYGSATSAPLSAAQPPPSYQARRAENSADTKPPEIADGRLCCRTRAGRTRTLQRDSCVRLGSRQRSDTLLLSPQSLGGNLFRLQQSVGVVGADFRRGGPEAEVRSRACPKLTSTRCLVRDGRVWPASHPLDRDRVLAGPGCWAQRAQLFRLLPLQPGLLPSGSDRGVHGPRSRTAGCGLIFPHLRTDSMIETGGLRCSDDGP
jgi:hypothetical protein